VNIPDEAANRYPGQFLGEVQRAAFIAGAEWARKEATNLAAVDNVWWHDETALAALDKWRTSGDGEHASPEAAFLDGYQARREEG